MYDSDYSGHANDDDGDDYLYHDSGRNRNGYDDNAAALFFDTLGYHFDRRGGGYSIGCRFSCCQAFPQARLK